jgi:hypothetical protein
MSEFTDSSQTYPRPPPTQSFEIEKPESTTLHNDTESEESDEGETEEKDAEIKEEEEKEEEQEEKEGETEGDD